ncbi:MAG TPA: CHASE sensor domain-containing protein, partial [Prosthecobacter sp.]|nr:CHASE sensor domain-containing protein [Prosthecobacter sp.]
MFPLRDAPIKRKLMVVILLTTSLALLLMAGAVVAYELATFRRALTTNTGVLAKVIGSISTGTLAFDDPNEAAEVLSVLSAEPQITSAAIYKTDGTIFARFSKPGAEAEIP